MSTTLENLKGEATGVMQQLLSLSSDLHQAVETEAQAQALLTALESAYLSLGQDFNKATGMGCPSGWFQCPDGSCVESEADCSRVGEIEA